jgi:hypothetical protein
MRTYIDKERKCVVQVVRWDYKGTVLFTLVDIATNQDYQVSLADFLSSRFEEVI